MAALTNYELNALDRSIDGGIPDQALLALPRDVALVHLLRVIIYLTHHDRGREDRTERGG
jgi:hypothetical protein